MKRLKRAIFFLPIELLFLIPISCAEDRDCGDGYIYKNQDNLCYKVSSDKPNERMSNNDADIEQDSSDGESVNIPAGFGDSCTNQEQCAGKDADFCSVNPLDGKGICTIKGCNGDDECPSEYYCCLAPESYGGHVCVTKELYDMGKLAGAC